MTHSASFHRWFVYNTQARSMCHWDERGGCCVWFLSGTEKCFYVPEGSRLFSLLFFFSFSTSTSLCNDIFSINYHLLKGVSSCRHIFSPPTLWVVIWNLDFLKQILIFISYASSAWFGSARLDSARLSACPQESVLKPLVVRASRGWAWILPLSTRQNIKSALL